MANEVTRADDGPWAISAFAPSPAAPVPVAREDAPGSDLSVATLLRIMFEWRWLILSMIALGLAAATIITLLTTPMYRSNVTLEANPPSVEIMDEKSSEGGAQDSFTFLATQVGLLNSRSLARRVAQDLNLVADPNVVDPKLDAATRLKIATGKVAGGLKVQMPKEGQLIGISYESDSPELAARIVNGIADTFIATNLERRYEASAYARNFLQKQIAKTRADLERSERQLVSYAQSQGIINTGTAAGGTAGDVGSLQGESLVALNKALAEATSRRIAAEGVYRSASGARNTVDVNASTQAMRQSKAVLESEYQEKRTLMKPDHPDMLSLRSRIDELDRQMRIETAQVVGGRSNSLQADYQAAAAAERALRSRVAALSGSVLNLRGRSIQYNIYQREVDTNRALYDALLQRYKEIGVAGGVGTNLISVVDRGEVPGGPYAPNLLLNLLAGFAFGLLSGFGLAIALEFLNDTVKTRDDVRKKLRLACIGAIPKRSGKGSFIEDLKDPTSVVSEAYAAVLGALRFSTKEGAPKTLLITSTRPNEGKSSTALALAQNLARLSKSVLLIDSDMRKPTFKAADNKRGLTPLLTTDEAVSENVVKTQYENLWLMPCGPIPPNPADLLATARFKEILVEAAEHFDFVVVDGPPVLGLADAPSLGAACDGTLMVVEAGRSRTKAIIAAIARVEASGAHILGVLLTKATERSGGYGYGYGSGYGYGQGAYRYGVGKNQNEILMIPHQGDN
jgi:capsular exopolysaccharide synthesis family protein